MNSALLVAVVGLGVAIVMVPFPAYSWVGRNVAPFVGTLGLVVALVASVVGSVIWVV